MLTLPGFTVLNPARFAVAAKQLRRNIKKKGNDKFPQKFGVQHNINVNTNQIAYIWAIYRYMNIQLLYIWGVREMKRGRGLSTCTLYVRDYLHHAILHKNWLKN